MTRGNWSSTIFAWYNSHDFDEQFEKVRQSQQMPIFESLSDRLQDVFTNLGRKGTLTEADVDAGLREVRMALLEADVNLKVAKNFIKRVKERAVGAEVQKSLTPCSTSHQNRQ